MDFIEIDFFVEHLCSISPIFQVNAAFLGGWRIYVAYHVKVERTFQLCLLVELAIILLVTLDGTFIPKALCWRNGDLCIIFGEIDSWQKSWIDLNVHYNQYSTEKTFFFSSISFGVIIARLTTTIMHIQVTQVSRRKLK